MKINSGNVGHSKLSVLCVYEYVTCECAVQAQFAYVYGYVSSDYYYLTQH